MLAPLFTQLIHSLGFNNVCDALRLHSGPLTATREAFPPSRSNFSHANRERDLAMAQSLFWRMLEHLQTLCPAFGAERRRKLALCFKRVIHLMDLTTIWLAANCLDRTKHRRRKAAAMCYLHLNLQDFLPRFAIVETTRDADAKGGRELCAGLQAAKIVISDRAYLNLGDLFDLFCGGVY